MTFQIGAADVQLAIAAGMALAGLFTLVRRRGAPPLLSGAPELALLCTLLLLGVANYFLLGRHPTQFVKAWDVQHSWFGSKYAAELGYFRIYECTIAFDAAQHGRYAGVTQISDLRAALSRVPAAAAAQASDCAARFSPERRAEFLRDLDFFQSLREQPNAQTWFTDNGYNQSPFYTALTSPLFQRVTPSYPLLIDLTLLDVALELAPFVVLAGAFGARTALLAAIFFFTSFWNQFAVMGGAILRFAYLAALLVAVGLFQRARPRAAGVALGISTLFQVFPASYALGLGLAAGFRWLRTRRLPGWALPFAASFAATLALGVLASLAVVDLSSWREFAQKIALHGDELSQYRAGLSFALLPAAPGGALDYASMLASLRGLAPLRALAGSLILLAALSLAPRLRALELAIVFASFALYVATPVHYYFATLVLLFLVVPGGDERARATVGLRTGLFGLSAGAFWLHRESGSLALVNNDWLSIGLLLVLLGWVVALHAEGGALEAERLELEAVGRRGDGH
jgi:hypothetical protein